MAYRGILKFLFILFALVQTSCINSPTIMSESDSSLIQRAYDFEKTNRPIKITPETVVLDVRAFFDYQLLRIPNSLYVDANEFSLRRKYGEALQEHATKLARRFSLMGINPFSHVVVVGYGDKGRGEEGLVALTLLALGVERVQVGTFSSFKFLATNKQSAAPQNKRYWEPRVVSTVICPVHGNNMAFIIDVGRKNSGSASTQKLATVAKEWKDFINTADLSPNPHVKESLRSDQIGEGARIMVRGPQAPIVVFSLLQLGYSSACVLDD